MLRKLVILAVMVLTPACCVTENVETEIGEQNTVGQRVVGEMWDSLSDDEQKEAYWRSVRGWAALNWAINDVEPTEEWRAEDPPWLAVEEEPAEAPAEPAEVPAEDPAAEPEGGE